MGNLLSNAVKFTRRNGTVTLSARRKEGSESGYARYEFSVADNGIGMTEEFMRRMYEAMRAIGVRPVGGSIIFREKEEHMQRIREKGGHRNP